MPPRPFPFPLGVGVDACRTDRMLDILENDARLNRWAKRVFTRLEWPWVYKRVNHAYSPLSSKSSEARLFLPTASHKVALNVDGGRDLDSIAPSIHGLAQFLAGRLGTGIEFLYFEFLEYADTWTSDGPRKKLQ